MSEQEQIHELEMQIHVLKIALMEACADMNGGYGQNARDDEKSYVENAEHAIAECVRLMQEDEVGS